MKQKTFNYRHCILINKRQEALPILLANLASLLFFEHVEFTNKSYDICISNIVKGVDDRASLVISSFCRKFVLSST
jgi:hypothetical protein